MAKDHLDSNYFTCTWFDNLIAHVTYNRLVKDEKMLEQKVFVLVMESVFGKIDNFELLFHQIFPWKTDESKKQDPILKKKRR